MINPRQDADWGPNPTELLQIARKSGCVVELEHGLSDGTKAYELKCPSHQAKVRLLANLAEYDSKHPEIMRLGERLAELGGGDPAKVAAVIHAFVRDGVKHTLEPREKFQPTGRTLSMGIADCDDSARAVLALLRAAGLRGGLLTLGDPPRHVAAAVKLADGFHWLDASIAANPGEHPIKAAQRLGIKVRPDLTGELGQQNGAQDATLPNMISLASFGMGVAWALGKSDGWGIASIVTDELDTWVADQTGGGGPFADLFDWATDLALTPMVWRRVGLPMRFLPVVTATQIGLRHYGWKPPAGSLRSALMAFQIARNAIRKRKGKR